VPIDLKYFIYYSFYSHKFHLSIGIFGNQFVITAIFIGERPVNQIEVNIIQANILQGLSAGILHPFRFMEIAPELRKYVAT